MSRVAIVAGAAAQTASAWALALAGAGFDVALLDANEDACAATADHIRELGRHAAVVVADLADAGSIAAAVAKVCAEMGDPAVLLNNIGVTGPGYLCSLSDAAWWDAIGVPLRAAFLACRAVVDPMIKNGGGRIITVADVAHEETENTTVRAGLEGLTRTLALELAPLGITANFLVAALPADEADEPGPRTRPNPATEGFGAHIAGIVSWLTGEDAPAVSCQVLRVGLA